VRSNIKDLDLITKISLNIIVKLAAAAFDASAGVLPSGYQMIRYYERADIGVAVAIEDGLSLRWCERQIKNH
jgi:hypothetical protein